MTTLVGTITQIWRYPVKSMMGERVDEAWLTEHGLAGDRAWATRDDVRGGIRGAKKLPGLMALRARYRQEPPPEGSVPAEITLPDGRTVMTDAPDASACVSAAIAHPVTLFPLRPADDLEHYRRGRPDSDDVVEELRAMFALGPTDPLPDLSGLPPVIFEYESPPGTYFDAFPLLLCTQDSLDGLQALAPQSRIDVRRFRPNLVVAPVVREAFVEDGWTDATLRIGDDAVIRVTIRCPRCVMTTTGFDDLPEDRSIMRTLVEQRDQAFGVYAEVVEPGRVRRNDTVELVATGANSPGRG
jgi:hypothetical protein